MSDVVTKRVNYNNGYGEISDGKGNRKKNPNTRDRFYNKYQSSGSAQSRGYPERCSPVSGSPQPAIKDYFENQAVETSSSGSEKSNNYVEKAGYW